MADSIVAQQETRALYSIPGKYRLDKYTGEPMPLGINDFPMDYARGCARGLDLARELIDWLPHYTQAQQGQGMTGFDGQIRAAEIVRELMDEAQATLSNPASSDGRRGQAVGLLDGLAQLVVTALAQGTDARRDLEKLREDRAEYHRQQADRG